MIIPSIKKAENIEWLMKNSETFLDYMSKHHSLADCLHTYLHIETFDDAYVENMIKNIEAAEKKRQKEAAILKKKIKGKKVSEIKETTAVDKMMAVTEEAAKAIEDEWEEEGELPD
jgi:hypothetical protein